MGSIETFITSVFDMFPVLKRTNIRRYLSILVICGTFFALGIIFCFQSGSYWLEIFGEMSERAEFTENFSNISSFFSF